MTTFRFPYNKTLLGALLGNESGGRNIANTHQGTTSGQAQGYFQITTGTWREFARKAGIDLNRYPTPMAAADGTAVPYSVQAQVASVIPLSRWDKTTIAAMNATGRRVDPRRTLGENLSGAGEGFGGGPSMQEVQNKAPVGYGPDRTTAQQPTVHAPDVAGPQAATDIAGPRPPQVPGTAAAAAPGSPLPIYPTVTPGGGAAPAPSDAPPPASNELTGADKQKSIGGLLGELAKGGDNRMQPMDLKQPSAGQAGSLADVIQQYLAAQMRGVQTPQQQQPTALTPPPPGGFRLG